MVMEHNKNLRPKSRRMAGTLLILLMLAVGTMWMLKVCSRPHNHEIAVNPSGGDTIDVAIEYSPLTFYQYSDTIGGFDYDLLRVLAQQGGLSVKFHPFSSMQNALDGLKNGLFDIVVADAPTTGELREEYAVSEPAYLDRQVLVQRRDSSRYVSSPLGLGGKSVWVPAGSPAVTRLRALASEIGDSIAIHTDSIHGSEQLFILTATGEIERAVINDRIARSMASDYPDVDVSAAISFTQFQSWIMRRDDTSLSSRIDTLLVNYKNSPAYSELHLRYFGE